MRNKTSLFLSLLLVLVLSACTSTAAVDTPTMEEKIPTQTSPPPPPAAAVKPSGDQPVQITGSVELTNNLILQVYFYERFVMLEDLTGFIARDYEYEQPLEAQILGPVVMNEDGELTFTLNLPAAPGYPLNDVDQDELEEDGVQAWQIIMNANYLDDPFLGENETGGWSASYTSTRIDAENKNEISGGQILIWAPDEKQEFPTGFGDDGLLFTEDDPVDTIPAGYSMVNLDSDPFGVYQEPVPVLTLYEGDIAVNDLSELSWTEGFDALHEKVSREYPFNEIKDIDWDALYDEIAPRIAEAEQEKDETAYYLALRDYTWSIPDGHVGLSFGTIGSQLFLDDIGGGYGFAITGLDDGRIITHLIIDGSPADEAGMEWGAEIISWNGIPIQEALEAVTPWSMPFSTETSLRLQQYRYLLRSPVGTEAEVTYQNPDASSETSTKLTAVSETESFDATSIYAGMDDTALPVEYEIMDNGYGYIKISSLSEDINLIIRLWEYGLSQMIEQGVPGIVIDLRQNSGGSPLGSFFGSYFVDERIDLSRSYYYSDKSGEFETYGPPDYMEPDDELYYDGLLGVLVSPACASACEDVAYVLSQLEQTRVFGYYPSDGIYGEVARGQYLLPGDYSLQAPTGLTRDMEGNIIIEGQGVVPDVFVPRTLENLYADTVLGEDVILDFAVDTLKKPIGAGITPESSPTVGTISQAESALQTQSTLEELAREEYGEEELSLAGETYLYTVPLSTSRKVIWWYPWCTADEASFKDNWSKIELEFSINGEMIPLDEFAVLEGVFSGSHCRAYYTVLDDWAPGEHVLTTTVTFTGGLDDGISDFLYPPGTHVYEYHVIVAR